MAADSKSDNAFRTIGELADELGLPQHILRYWETRFPQLRPLQRAGNRRYYRPADVELAKRINRLLNSEGYTVKGVQKLLANRGSEPKAVVLAEQSATSPISNTSPYAEAIKAIRNRLKRALEADDIAARV